MNRPEAEAPLATRAGTAPNGQPITLSDRVRSLRLPDQAARPPAPSRLPWLLCLALAGACAYLGYRQSTAPQPSPEDGTPGPTASASPGDAGEAPPADSRGMTSGGFIIPVRRVQVSPKVGGQAIHVYFQEGDFVKKDQVLAEIDPTKYDYNYRRLKAAAEQAKAELDKTVYGWREEEKLQAEHSWREAVENCEQLKDELVRLERARNAASAEDLVKSRSRLEQATRRAEQLKQAYLMMKHGSRKEDIAKCRAAWENAVAMCEDAKYDLDNTRVLAPDDGTILKKYAEEGNMVRPEAFSNGLSASLYDMADLKKLEVDIDVPERDIGLVHKGQRCEVWPEAFPKKIYGGYVSRLMPEATRSKASVFVRVRIEIPDDDDLLRPEMRARVRFLSEDGKKSKDAAKK
jgi:multidrug efflux pump subunit AcrA (membrane-fusion protein)